MQIISKKNKHNPAIVTVSNFFTDLNKTSEWRVVNTLNKTLFDHFRQF